MNVGFGPDEEVLKVACFIPKGFGSEFLVKGLGAGLDRRNFFKVPISLSRLPALDFRIECMVSGGWMASLIRVCKDVGMRVRQKCLCSDAVALWNQFVTVPMSEVCQV